MKPGHLKIFKYLCIEVVLLISLGAGVRAMDAGLACPDWPLCFGDIIPDYHPQVFSLVIHRALAGVVAITTLYLAFVMIRTEEISATLKWIAVAAVVVLMAQVVMGGLTVLLKLHNKVVTTHLFLGVSFFALLFWIYQNLADQRDMTGVPSGPAVGLLVLTFAQLLLGGQVASNYAAGVCGTEFPLCHGSFIPTLQGTIGLHVSHRLLGYVLFAYACGFLFWTLRSQIATPRQRQWSKIYFGLLCLQIILGILNVKFSTPPLFVVLHLAVATLMVGATTRLIFLSLKPIPHPAGAKAQLA